jgi:hypothetical protein
MVEGSLYFFRPSIGVVVTTAGRAADPAAVYIYLHNRNGYSQTPIPRGDEPPDAVAPGAAGRSSDLQARTGWCS